MAKRPRMGDIYKEYVARCFKAGAMDFDDLLLKTNELLTKFPEVLAKYQDRFRYILVDEYQDTNHSQYLIIRALSDKFQNICVVGDDAQSIYAFRGANINNIFNFQKDYDNVQVYRLEQNYRSTSVIVEAANSVIENNEQRLEKEVWTDNEPGAPIKVHLSPTDADEGRFVAASIVENIEQNENDYADYAILYRTNAQSRALEDALRRRNVPYRIYGGLSFYQRKEIKDVLSYLRLLVNPKDEEALKRVINYPTRGIGQTTIDRLTIAANHYERSIYEVIENIDRIDLKINAGIRTRLKNFLILIQSLTVSAQTMDAFELTDLVSRKTGLVTEFKKDSSPEGMLRVENLEELLNGIKDFVEQQKEIDGATGDITEFLEDVALATDLDKDVADNNRVALMTVHLAKGLEFPYVYIVGLEENLFPSGMNLNSRTELEEERRLFYVALTRAEKQAYLTYAQSRYQWGKLTDAEPSRFIDEIDDKFLQYLSPQGSRRFRSLTNFDKFDEVDKNRYRQVKPVAGTPPKGPSAAESRKLRKLKPVSSLDKAKAGVKLEKGQIVEHDRFGKGRVLHVEGVGGDAKAEIQFDNGGLKRLILRFAKLEILS
ncbi:MAG TPA: 3'-5' exonuclease, partial [Flavobacteriaceae bacterium]|nr:3'-5' exonuclease [Flavobacteriaceae bacterium]